MFSFGSTHFGGGVTYAQYPVRTVYSTLYAFATLTEAGTVYCFGFEERGGDCDHLSSISDIVSITSGINSFAGLRADQTIVVWGLEQSGACQNTATKVFDTDIYSCLPVNVRGILAIYANEGGSFVALRAVNGTTDLIAWGTKSQGGNSSSPEHIYDHPSSVALSTDITGVTDVIPGSTVYIAMNKSKVLAVWGRYSGGAAPSTSAGSPSNSWNSGVPSALWTSDIEQIFGSTVSSDSTTAGGYKCPYGYYGSFPNCKQCDNYGGDSTTSPPPFRNSLAETRNETSCTSCDTGYYPLSNFPYQCAQCPASMYSLPNSRNSLGCMSCYGGVESQAKANYCTSCPIGTYDNADIDDNTVDSNCIPCVVGKYGERQGTDESVCSNCLAGKSSSNDTAGASSCGDCPAGRYSLDGSGCIDCSPGTYSELTGVSTCVACPTGRFVIQSGQRECTICPEGTYNPVLGSPVCIFCTGGKYSSVIGANTSAVCRDCDAGQYSTLGASVCNQVPPGHYTTEISTKDLFIPCKAGRYQPQAGQQNCSIVPPGTYAGNGSAVALGCPAGRYVSYAGSKSIAECNLCDPGKTSINAASECKECANGFYANFSGASECKDCALQFGEFFTSVGDHTSCYEDERLRNILNQENLIAVLFRKGVALSGAGFIAVIFLLVAGLLYHKKKEFISVASSIATGQQTEAAGANQGEGGDQLGNLALMTMVFKSLPSGLAFGSELFLVIGILGSGDAPGLAAIMILFRLAHFFASILLLTCIYGRAHENTVQSLLIGADAMDLKDEIHIPFSIANMPFVGVLVILSFFDVTMLQNLPWKSTKFYLETKGFASLGMLKFSTGIKVMQSFVSVVCQIYYLIANSNLDDGTTSPQAKALFIMNIIVSMTGAILGLILLLLNSTVLKKIEDERAKRITENRKKKHIQIQRGRMQARRSTLQLSDVYSPSIGHSTSSSFSSSMAAVIENQGGVYNSGCEGGMMMMAMTDNPLYTIDSVLQGQRRDEDESCGHEGPLSGKEEELRRELIYWKEKYFELQKSAQQNQENDGGDGGAERSFSSASIDSQQAPPSHSSLKIGKQKPRERKISIDL